MESQANKCWLEILVYIIATQVHRDHPLAQARPLRRIMLLQL